MRKWVGSIPKRLPERVLRGLRPMFGYRLAHCYDSIDSGAGESAGGANLSSRRASGSGNMR